MLLSVQRPTKYKVAVSLDSRRYFERYRSRSLVGDENIPLQRVDSDIESQRDNSEEYMDESE